MSWWRRKKSQAQESGSESKPARQPGFRDTPLGSAGGVGGEPVGQDSVAKASPETSRGTDAPDEPKQPTDARPQSAFRDTPLPTASTTLTESAASSTGTEQGKASLKFDQALTPSEADTPFWMRREYVWPLSIFLGFATMAVGLQLPLLGCGTLLAAIGLVPMYRAFSDQGDLRYAFFICMGWTIGLWGAMVGLALEGHLDLVLQRVPFAELAASQWIEPWVPRGERRLEFDPSGSTLALIGALIVFGLSGRYLRGVFLASWGALLAGAIGALGAWVADRAAVAEVDPLVAGALGWSPGLVLAYFGALAAAVAMGAPGPIWPLSQLLNGGEWRRRALTIAWPAGLVAGLLHLLFNESWGRWVVAQLQG